MKELKETRFVDFCFCKNKDLSLWYYGKIVTFSSDSCPGLEVSVYASCAKVRYVRLRDNFDAVVKDLAESFDDDIDVVFNVRGISAEEITASDEIQDVYFSAEGCNVYDALNSFFKDDDEILNVSEAVVIEVEDEECYSTRLIVDEENYFFLRLTNSDGTMIDRLIGGEDSHWMSKAIEKAKRFLREYETAVA